MDHDPVAAPKTADIRTFLAGFLPAILMLVIAVAVLVPAFRAMRIKVHHQRVSHLLLEIQHALQDWHVAEEIYPRETPMSGAELIALLVASEHLDRPPHNPWTGHPYDPAGESAASDRIRYSTDELAETYSLKALKQKSDDILLELDSTEHQSLE